MVNRKAEYDSKWLQVFMSLFFRHTITAYFSFFFLMFLWLNSGKWSISTCCVPLLSKRPSPTHAHKIIKNFHVVIYPFFPGNLSGPNTQDHLGNNVEMASPCQLKLLSGQAPVNVNTHWIRPYLNAKRLIMPIHWVLGVYLFQQTASFY